MTRLIGLTLVIALVAMMNPSAVGAEYPSETLGFEDLPRDQADDTETHELFWAPEWSGSTADRVVPNATSTSYDTNAVFRSSALPAVDDAALEVFFSWVSASDPDSWVRLTTFNHTVHPNPGLDTQGKVRFKVTNRGQLFWGTFGIALGIRETGNFVAQMDDAGTAGDIEWVGVDPEYNGIIAGSNGIVDTTASGDDVQEYAVGFDVINNDLPSGTAIITPGNNGVIDTVPAGDDEYRNGYFISTNGARVPIPVFNVPVNSSYFSLEFDLATGDITVDGPGYSNVTIDGGIAGMTGNGILDAANNRGALEHIAVVNVPSDTTIDMDFAIDAMQFEATTPDPVSPPSIQAPVYVTDTQVRVDCHEYATEALLLIDGTTNGLPVAPTDGVATFTGLTLTEGNILTAKQVVWTVKSAESNPVPVFAEGVVMADNFDNYNSDAELHDFWHDSIASPDPADARVRLQAGGAASCPNFLREDNPASSNAARLYWDLGSVNGTNDDPIWVTWNFKHVGEEGAAGARTQFVLARFDSGSFNTGAQAEGSVAINIKNTIGSMVDQFALGIVSTNGLTTSNGFTTEGAWNFAASGVETVTDRWYKMQIKIDGDYVNYYIDDELVTPGDFTIAGGAAADGIPRPNSLGYDCIIIGQGYSNNGPMMMFDNVSVTTGSDGSLHPFSDPVTAAPTVEEPLYPSLATVTVSDIDTNATLVEVFSDGGSIGSATSGYETGSVAIPVSPALIMGADITAKQTVGGVVSCGSIPITVGVPTVTIADENLLPGATTVNVSGLAEGVATSIKIYANELSLIATLPNPATDPVAVTVPALIDGDYITATQTIGGVEGDQSEPKLVRIPPDLRLTVTLCLDEDGNGGLTPADYEYVGATNKVGTNAPVGKTLDVVPGEWQHFEFSLVPGVEPVQAWYGGDGVLSPDGGDYGIDSFFFTINSNGASSGPYNIYIDHLYYIDATDTKILLDDSEAGNVFPERRWNEPGLPTTQSSSLSSVTSKDGRRSTKVSWEWPDENDDNYIAARPQYPRFPIADTAKAIGLYVYLEDPTSDVPRPTVLEPIIGDVDFVRIVDVNSNATAVDLYLNGAHYDTVVPSNGFADFDTSTVTLQTMDEFTATVTTSEGTSDKAMPRGVVDAPSAPSVEDPILEGATEVIVNDVLTLPNGTATLVTVYDGTTVLGTAAGGTESVVVTVSPLFAGTRVTATQTVNGIESDPSLSITVVMEQTPCGVVFSDDFNTDTSANYDVIFSSADAEVNFAWDYSAMGIPAAPNGTGTLGVMFKANMVSPGATESVTITPIGEQFGGDYKLTFDMWVNANGPFPGGGTGSTEFITAGIGYDGVTPNVGGGTGSGAWFAACGEGGSSRDYRGYKFGNEQFVASGQYLVGSNNNLDAGIAAYFPGLAPPAWQVTNYAQQSGTLSNGSVGFAWREIEIVRLGDTVTWTLDGLPICKLDATVGTPFPLTGSISLGYADLFTSVSDNIDLSFGIIDNVKVEGWDGGDCNGNGIADGCETISGGDWDASGVVDLDDFVAFADCMEGPDLAPAPFESDCVQSCLDAFDFDTDGDVDLRDFSAFAVVFDGP